MCTVIYKKELDGSTTKIETITTQNCDPPGEIKTIDDEITRIEDYKAKLVIKKAEIVDATRSLKS